LRGNARPQFAFGGLIRHAQGPRSGA
jgi:hypothetical protein